MRKLLLPALLLALAGCGGPGSPAAAPPTTPGPVLLAGSTQPGTVVLDVSRNGGWCAEGLCRHPHLRVLADGSWSVRTPGPDGTWTSRRGDLTSAQSAALGQALSTTQLTQHPVAERFCQSWVDGFDVEVRWRASGVARSASSCDYDFGDADPLIAFAEALADLDV